MSASKPQWQVDLERDGYVVVPEVVPARDCAEFREEAEQWLEKFPHGYKVCAWNSHVQVNFSIPRLTHHDCSL